MRPTVIEQNFYLIHIRCSVHRLQEAVQLRLLLSASDDFLEDAARARVHGGEKPVCFKHFNVKRNRQMHMKNISHTTTSTRMFMG